MSQLALDHVAFGVLDAAAAAQSFERLGFTATGLSRCAWDAGTGPASAAAASVVFPGQYVDLVENTDPRWIRHVESAPLYAAGAAPSGIVLGGRSREDLRRDDASYRITRTLPGARPGEMHYEFLAARGLGLPVSFVHDSEREAMRTDAWTRHANTAMGIRRLHVRVPSMDAVTAELDVDPLGIRLTEEPDDDYLRDVCALLTGRHTALLSIEFDVESLPEARGCLEREGVAFRAAPARLRVAPRECPGVGVELVAASRATPEVRPERR